MLLARRISVATVRCAARAPLAQRPRAAVAALRAPIGRAPTRRLASDAKKPETATEKALAEAAEAEDALAEPLTPAQKVGMGINLGAWAAGLGLAAVCGFYIVRELLPWARRADALGAAPRARAPRRGTDRTHRGATAATARIVF